MEEKRPNEQLRRERDIRGWSQRALAELLGTTEQVVNHWERGSHKPNRHFQTQLCHLFGKNAEELGFMEQVQIRREEGEVHYDRQKKLPAQPSSFQQEQSMSLDEKTIAKFEKITADCWLLLRSDGLPTVEQLLPTYLPRFALFAQRSSKYQERAARIVTQGYILQGLVAVLNSNLADSERFCEEAVFYARIAKDHNLEAAALKHLATKFLDNGYPLQALQTYQEVQPFVEEISPLLQGRTYLGLSLAYARTNQENKALYYLDRACDSFPDNPEGDFSFSYADCHTSSLNHYGGLIQAEFGRFEKAHNLFARVEELPTKHTVPERTRIEIMNCQAETSLALRDVGSSRDLIEKSLIGALHLKSDKRYNDALMLYKHARLLFPQEDQIKNLAELFIR